MDIFFTNGIIQRLCIKITPDTYLSGFGIKFQKKNLLPINTKRKYRENRHTDTILSTLYSAVILY
jgi:hypothetical protein